MPMLVPNALHDQKSHVLRNAIVPFTMLSASHDVDMMPMVPHDQKSNVTFHFNHLALRNAVVPFMMLLVSCDTGIVANGVLLPKSHVAIIFSILT